MAAILSIVSGLFFGACTPSRQNDDTTKMHEYVEDLVSQWVGKELNLDRSLGYFTTDGDSGKVLFPRANFFILRYIGPSDCTPCRLHLRRYPRILKTLSDSAQTEIGFICIINSSDIEEVNRTLRSENMSNLSMWIDTNDTLNKINHFPEIEKLQTFLVDRNHKVLAVGDPAINPGVMEHYLRVLTNGTINPKSLPKTILQSSQYSIDLGNVVRGDTAVCNFVITNVGTSDFMLDEIISSCDCTVASIDNYKLVPGDSTILTVRFSETEEVGPFYRLISIFGNLEEELTFEITGTLQ